MEFLLVSKGSPRGFLSPIVPNAHRPRLSLTLLRESLTGGPADEVALPSQSGRLKTPAPVLKTGDHATFDWLWLPPPLTQQPLCLFTQLRQRIKLPRIIDFETIMPSNTDPDDQPIDNNTRRA
jgi:hypothetical protein